MPDFTQVRDVYEHLDEITLVDCRETYEWVAGHVAGAVHIPVNAIMGGAGSDLDPTKPVAVICRTGNRSELGSMMLQARGFDAYNVAGGMESWAAEGLPYVSEDGSPERVA
jgi:rhodanese-related sulfurtransferase